MERTAVEFSAKVRRVPIGESLFVGVTAQVSTGIFSAGKNIGDAASKITKISDKYSAANAVFAGLKASDSIDDLKKIAEGKGNIISGSLSIGFSQSKSEAASQSSDPFVTSLNAGQSVTIDAANDINSSGAQISAGYDAFGLPVTSSDPKAGDITLKAGNDINRGSAQATTENSSSNNSSSAGIGIAAGVTAKGVNVGMTGNFAVAAGSSKGNGTSQVNSHVVGSGDISIDSGRDTNLKGAVVSGDTITAEVGRDLNIVSVPDVGEVSNKSASFRGHFWWTDGQHAFHYGNTARWRRRFGQDQLDHRAVRHGCI